MIVKNQWLFWYITIINVYQEMYKKLREVALFLPCTQTLKRPPKHDQLNRRPNFTLRSKINIFGNTFQSSCLNFDAKSRKCNQKGLCPDSVSLRNHIFSPLSPEEVLQIFCLILSILRIHSFWSREFWVYCFCLHLQQNNLAKESNFLQGIMQLF